MKGFIWRRIRNLAGVDIRQRIRKALRKEGEKHVENETEELKNANDMRETSCVVVGGGQAGAMLSQPRLFRLESLGEGGWLKTLRLKDYAPRRFRSESLQQVLFPYHEAWV